jgi:hypothetical protein
MSMIWSYPWFGQSLVVANYSCEVQTHGHVPTMEECVGPLINV